MVHSRTHESVLRKLAIKLHSHPQFEKAQLYNILSRVCPEED